jgi:hypothetical protein
MRVGGEPSRPPSPLHSDLLPMPAQFQAQSKADALAPANYVPPPALARWDDASVTAYMILPQGWSLAAIDADGA